MLGKDDRGTRNSREETLQEPSTRSGWAKDWGKVVKLAPSSSIEIWWGFWDLHSRGWKGVNIWLHAKQSLDAFLFGNLYHLYVPPLIAFSFQISFSAYYLPGKCLSICLHCCEMFSMTILSKLFSWFLASCNFVSCFFQFSLLKFL